MKRSMLFLVLTFAALSGSALTARQTVWIAVNHTPSMGHAASPSNQDVTQSTTYYTLTASVTDLDTYYNNLDPNQTSLQAGYETDVLIMKNFSYSGTPNQSFDASSGKREVVYTFSPPPALLNSGEVHKITYTFYGHDTKIDARQDPDTLPSQCNVYLKYLPKPSDPPLD